MELNTFSIAAHCSRTGQLGVAVASAVPAVGGLCPYLRAGIGAVTTHSWVNPYLALRSLDGLAGGQTPDAALAALDPREAVAIEFLIPSAGADQVRTAYIEVGDFAAGRAFLTASQR